MARVILDQELLPRLPDVDGKRVRLIADVAETNPMAKGALLVR